MTFKCDGKSDNSCSPCSTCSSDQNLLSECSQTKDTVCETSTKKGEGEAGEDAEQPSEEWTTTQILAVVGGAVGGSAAAVGVGKVASSQMQKLRRKKSYKNIDNNECTEDKQKSIEMENKSDQKEIAQPKDLTENKAQNKDVNKI